MSSRPGGRPPASACRTSLAARVWDLPPWAFYPILDQPLWKWLSAFLATLVTAGFGWVVWRAGRKWDRRCARLDVGWRIGEPAAALCAIALLAGLEMFLERVVLFRERPGVATSVAIDAIRYLLLAWFVAVVIAGIGKAVVRLFVSGAGSLDAALIRLCFRILSIAGALFVLLYAAAEFGIGITPIIAGLGVGGLAVALAIRPTRVRLSELGDAAYVLELFAFVTAADWGEFLAIKEDLNLRIAEIVRESGTSFAFPSQTVYFTRDAGVNAGRGEATEAEVRQWREEQRLPFPDFAFAERVEMEDTIPFPSEGSPDYQPGPPRNAMPDAREDTRKRRGRWPALLRRNREHAGT